MLGLKGQLKKRKEISDMVALINLEVKENFKNIKLEDCKLSNDLLLFIMHQVELKCKDLSRKTLKSLDKNEIVRLIYIELFEKLSPEDETFVENSIEFIITNKLIAVNNWVIKRAVKSFFACLVSRFK